MASEQSAYLEKLEARFRKLLEQMQPAFSRETLAEFKEYIEVGEYGLALDTAQWMYIKGNEKVSPEIFQIITELAETMQVPLHGSFVSTRTHQ